MDAAVAARRSALVVPVAVGDLAAIDPDGILPVATDTRPGDSCWDLAGFGCDGGHRHIDWNRLLFVLLPY